ncbi:hypothetical protein EV363DRAFT_1215048 [Boletus edulis]|nr:hypothetical protein EV363DRAFT_1215048 [Boletus edulis]
MVLTRSAAKRLEPEQATGDNLVENPPGDCGLSLAKKRRRQGSTTAPKKRRRRGPGKMCQLNLDVLFLIAEYLCPMDLLNLARTCKSLRQLLMVKSSAFVWKAARRQIDRLPDCPADLTEPQYANLVFYPRCHICGKYAKAVLWEMRRRYCLGCTVRRLSALSSCPQVVQNNNVVASEDTALTDGVTKSCVDKDQMESFIHEYKHSSNRKQFVMDRVEQHAAISMHARECEEWEWYQGYKHYDEMRDRRKEREYSIIERLKQLGFEREVGYFTPRRITESCKSLFWKFKPLTNKEWNQLLPKTLKTMNDFRSMRLESVVHRPRRQLLASEYANYMTHPLPNAPAFDIFPHVADVASFSAFRDIIKAPEDAQISFEFAFAELPELVGKWREKLDAEFADLVKIPSHLSLAGVSSDRAVASSGDAGLGPSQTAMDKLRLACALFRANYVGLFSYPEVLFISKTEYSKYPTYDEHDLRCNGSIQDRYGIKYIVEAPYVVHACGLDPNVATVEDMDHQNARLKCLSCEDSCVRDWRAAVWHALYVHRWLRESELPRLQLVSDEHLAAELSLKEELDRDLFRCLLCLPHVGGRIGRSSITGHLMDEHKIKLLDIRQDVHYTAIGMTPVNTSLTDPDYCQWLNYLNG